MRTIALVFLALTLAVSSIPLSHRAAGFSDTGGESVGGVDVADGQSGATGLGVGGVDPGIAGSASAIGPLGATGNREGNAYYDPGSGASAPGEISDITTPTGPATNGMPLSSRDGAAPTTGQAGGAVGGVVDQLTDVGEGSSEAHLD